MAQDVGTVYVQVEPSGRGFGRKIEGDLGNSIEKASTRGSTSLVGKMGDAFNKIGKTGLGVIGTITGGIAGLAAKGGFGRALAIENAQAKLKGLGHSAGDVTEIMTDALNSVKGTAFGLGDAATVAASLSASGIKSGSQMTRVLKTVADTAQISGRSLTDIGTIFGSVAARGKLQGDDMLQLMSSGIPVLQLLGKHLGKTSAQISDMVSSGKIDFQTFADAMEEGLGGAALAAGSTFQGAFDNMRAAMGRLGEEFGTPVLNAARDLLNKLNPAIDAVAKQLKPFADMFGDKLAPAVKQAGDWLSAFTDNLNNGKESIGDLAGKIASLAAGFGVLAGVGGNVKTVSEAFDRIGHAGDKGISDLVSKLQGLPEGLQGAMGGLQQFKGYFNKDLREAMAVDGDPFANALNRIGKGLDGLTAPFRSLGSKLADTRIGGTIAGLGSSIGTGFGKLTSTADLHLKVFSTRLGQGFSSAFDKLGDSKIGAAFGRVGEGIKGAFAPLASGVGNLFGGLGDIIAGPLQSSLGKVGSMVGNFFAPGNFLKFFGIGAIIAGLVAGLGLLDQSMNGGLSTAIDSIAKQAPAMIGHFTATILDALPEIMASGSEVVVSLLNGITTAAPSLIAGAAQIIAALVRGLAQNLPQIIPAALTMIMTLITSLVQQLPLIMSAGMQLLNGIIQGLVAALPQLAEQIPTLISTILTSLTTLLPLLLTGGMNILLGLIQGLVDALPQLVAQIPTIINAIITTLSQNLPQIIQIGVQVLLSLINGLVNSLPQLVSQIPVIIASIVNTLTQNLPQIISAGIQIIITLANGLVQAIPKLLAALPQIISGIKNGFAQVNWGEIGINIIKGIVNGLSGAAKQLAQAAADAAGNALNWVKEKLGIHSPSRVFRDQVGVMIGRGMALGIDDSQAIVNHSFDKLAAGLTLSNQTLSMDAASTNLMHPNEPNQASNSGAQVTVDIDARGTNPDVLFAMFDTRAAAAVSRWG